MLKRKILVVDDEETLCDVLKFNLEEEGYEVDTAYSAEEALAMDLGCYSLFMLDIMMGEISGMQLARILRGRADTALTPIIFLTALGGEKDMVEGLDLGADDYIAKPYSLRNVKARVRSVLRRCDARAHGARAVQPEPAGLVVDAESKTCTVDGREVPMPRKEFEILSFLMAHPGEVFSREQLLERLWPESVVVDRVIDVNITRLRAKLGTYGKKIVTRSGYGYGFRE